MSFLLDTQLLLWLALVTQRLPERARQLIQDPDNRLYFSTISIWEIVIKAARGRSDFKVDAAMLRLQLLENGFLELTLTGNHVLQVGTLPNFHKDPFDRALIAQAESEGITLLTADSTLAKYPGAIQKV